MLLAQYDRCLTLRVIKILAHYADMYYFLALVFLLYFFALCGDSIVHKKFTNIYYVALISTMRDKTSAPYNIPLLPLGASSYVKLRLPSLAAEPPENSVCPLSHFLLYLSSAQSDTTVHFFNLKGIQLLLILLS